MNENNNNNSDENQEFAEQLAEQATSTSSSIRVSVGNDSSALPRSPSANLLINHQSIENFLSIAGVVNPTTTKQPQRFEQTQQQQQQLKEDELIFESSFDLTEERLRYVFNMFDTDDDGKISYESLKQGLEFHTNTMSSLPSSSSSSAAVDETSFQELISLLDTDGSGDITMEEFAEGIRLLMLRALFFHRGTGGGSSSSPFQVLDYNTTRLERKVIVQSSLSSSVPFPLSSSDKEKGGSFRPPPNTRIKTDSISSSDFFFHLRPDWVSTRWIHLAATIHNNSADLTMKRLAVKYLLHPLALEDALSSETHRPKVEVYSNHYFIMIPIFSIIPGGTGGDGGDGESDSDYDDDDSQVENSGIINDHNNSSRSSSTASHSRNKKKRPKLSKIIKEMVSIFVNIPRNDTIITFQNKATAASRTYSSGRHPHDYCYNYYFKRVEQELEKSYSKLRQYDAQYLTYALLDQAVDLLLPIVKTKRSEIRRERELLRREHFSDMDRVKLIQEELEKVCRNLRPFLRLLTHVIEDDAIVPGATIYIRDVRDNLECIDDDLKELVEICQSLDAEAEKYHDRQMNQTLYTLTVISAVFLPAQFLTGLWGMNFQTMPELGLAWGYPMFWGLTCVMTITLLFVFNCGRLK